MFILRAAGSGGRDPKGRSLDEEIKLGKQEWLKKQRIRINEKTFRDLGSGLKGCSVARCPGPVFF